MHRTVFMVQNAGKQVLQSHGTSSAAAVTMRHGVSANALTFSHSLTDMSVVRLRAEGGDACCS
jgi:ABC-type sulfate transport system substrate-binding protein